ncbi:hypothetical protein Tco_0097782 [Tanacetum coccineum]
MALFKVTTRKSTNRNHNNLRNFIKQTRNKKVDTTPRYNNDKQNWTVLESEAVNVAGSRETIGLAAKPKRGLKTSTYHKEKIKLGVNKRERIYNIKQSQFLTGLSRHDNKLNEQELEAHYSYMAKIQEASEYDNPDPAPELQNVSPSADTTVPSQQELDLLFGPLYDEFFNDGTSCVNKSSSPTYNSIKKDTLPSTHIQPTSELTTPTNVHAKENNDNQPEFTNPFCTPVQEITESSSRNIDPEMCMFALTMSIVKLKKIKEAMADSAWIEAMQEELHQFDRIQV